MYARLHGDRTLTFDFVAGLRHDNLLIADRETGSVWSQLEGQAVSGPLAGEPLVMVPALQTTWKHWRELHPETRVLIDTEEEGRPYYYRDRTAKDRKKSQSHDTTTLGLGLVVGGEALLVRLRDLDQRPSPFTVELGGETLTIHHRRDAHTAWANDAAGNLVPSVLAYETGWLAFYPESEVLAASSAAARE